MIDRIEALAALARHGTTGRAATALRITQSAVSKRVAALESELGRRLVERDGRRVRLTEAGERFLAAVRAPLADLRAACDAEAAPSARALRVGVSESVLASWGAPLLAHACAAAGGVTPTPHAHRSPVVLDHVRAADYDLALVAGESDAAPDLVFEPLGEERLVVVPSARARLTVVRGSTLRVRSIERSSATWRSVARRLAHLRRAAGVEIVVDEVVESFAAAVALARAGFGPALVPAGIADALGVRRPVELPAPGLARPVALAARRSVLARPEVRAFADALRRAAPRFVPGPAATRNS
mgnify:CR=1 FL=1